MLTRQAVGLLGVGLAVLLLAHHKTVADLAFQWWDYLSHGFVLVALVAWVIWRDRAQLLSEPTVWWPAALLVGLSAVMWFIGASSGIRVVEQWAFVTLLVGWGLGTLGREKAAPILRIGGYLALSMPMWGLITPILQRITVAANSALLAVSGLEAKIDGNYIAIPEGTFEVAGSCAGTAFFLSGLTVAVSYWEISPLSARGRWLAMALMASLSLISNWIRVFLLILIGHWTNMQSPLIADHGWFGWMLFALMIGLFLFITKAIEARYAVPLPQDDRVPAVSLQAQRSFAGGNSLAVLVLTGIGIAGPMGAAALASIPRAAATASVQGLSPSSVWVARPPFERAPLAVGDSLAGDSWAPQYAGADRHQVQQWIQGADTVQVDRLIFSGVDHRHKLFADGNVMGARRALLLDRAIGIPDRNGVRSFRQAVVRIDSTSLRAMLYWFRVGRTSTGVPLVGRLLEAGAAIRRSAPSELIVTSIVCRSDCEVEFDQLRAFVLGPAPQLQGKQQ